MISLQRNRHLFLVELKSQLKDGEVIVQEIFSFIIQDAVQGSHRNNDLATIHPFVAYFNGKDKRPNPEEGIRSLNFVITSDSLSTQCSVSTLFH